MVVIARQKFYYLPYGYASKYNRLSRCWPHDVTNMSIYLPASSIIPRRLRVIIYATGIAGHGLSTTTVQDQRKIRAEQNLTNLPPQIQFKLVKWAFTGSSKYLVTRASKAIN